jgi:hypothetical protein
MIGARLVNLFLQLVALVALTWSAGCGGEEEVGTPEQFEKARQHKIEQAKRFQQDG